MSQNYAWRSRCVAGSCSVVDAVHAVSLSSHHDARVERRFVTVTLLPCPMSREKHSLATVFPLLTDKIDYPCSSPGGNADPVPPRSVGHGAIICYSSDSSR